VSMLLCQTDCRSGGVTVITHGWSPTPGAPVWLSGMQDAVSEEWIEGEETSGRIAITSDPSGQLDFQYDSWEGDIQNSPSGEAVLVLDWTSVANHLVPTGKVTQEVAPVAVEALLGAPQGGPSLVEQPVHLIGHSRGSSLVCEMARLLGEEGVFVDQITLLDPHPLTEKDRDKAIKAVDAPIQLSENVLFADCYYQTMSYPTGEYAPGAYNRQLTNLPGGYNAVSPLFASHSNAHLWYHGTVDLATGASDGEASVGAAERGTWWNDYETVEGRPGSKAGYWYSRISGKGDRKSTDVPVEGGDRVADGQHQAWEGASVRSSLDLSQANWPNIFDYGVITEEDLAVGIDPIDILGAGTYPIQSGQRLELVYAAWVHPGDFEIDFHADRDRNPYNGNDILLMATDELTATESGVYANTFFWIASTDTPDATHSIYARITDGTRERVFYSAASLRIVEGDPTPTPTLTATPVATPTPTPSPDYDVAPDGGDGRIDAHDLLALIGTGFEGPGTAFDFAGYWYAGVSSKSPKE
jgi:hypothetical protein